MATPKEQRRPLPRKYRHVGQLVAEQGLTVDSWRFCKSSHFKITVRNAAGALRSFVFGGTVSDHRAIHNARAALRRHAQGMPDAQEA